MEEGIDLCSSFQLFLKELLVIFSTLLLCNVFRLIVTDLELYTLPLATLIALAVLLASLAPITLLLLL